MYEDGSTYYSVKFFSRVLIEFDLYCSLGFFSRKRTVYRKVVFGEEFMVKLVKKKKNKKTFREDVKMKRIGNCHVKFNFFTNFTFFKFRNSGWQREQHFP